MKNIFSFKVDLGNIKGAISSLNSLNVTTSKVEGAFTKMQKSFSREPNKINGPISSINKHLKNLYTTTKLVGLSFGSLGKSIRSISSNFLSKFISVLKIGLGLVTSLTAGVIGAFNIGNGANRVATQGVYSGLNWAGQKALNNANEETGFTASFNSTKNLLNDGVEALKFQTMLGLSDKELEKLKNNPTAFYDIAKLLKSKYDLLEGDGAIKMEQFKALYGESLQNALNLDPVEFVRLMEAGVIDKHQERFTSTYNKYKNVDFKGLMAGEKALDDFSETLKAFALNLASKFLPPLTKTLKQFTSYLSNVSEFLTKSGVLESAAKMIGQIIGAFSTLATGVANLFKKITGVPIIEYIKGVFSFIGNIFELLANVLTGNFTKAAINAKDIYSQSKNVFSHMLDRFNSSKDKQVEATSVATNYNYETQTTKTFNSVISDNSNSSGAVTNVKSSKTMPLISDSESAFLDAFLTRQQIGAYQSAEEISSVATILSKVINEKGELAQNIRLEQPLNVYLNGIKVASEKLVTNYDKADSLIQKGKSMSYQVNTGF